jgi:hypothetical protein
MSQLTFTSLQQLLATQSQRSFTELTQTHPFSFSQNQPALPSNRNPMHRPIETQESENARNDFQFRRIESRQQGNPFSLRSENSINGSDLADRKLLKITGAKKVLPSQKRPALNLTKGTGISESQVQSQSHLSRSPARNSESKSQRSKGSPRTSDAKDKNLKSPFSKNGSASKNQNPEITTATRHFDQTNGHRTALTENSNLSNMRRFRPQIDLVVKPLCTIIAEYAEPDLDGSDNDKPHNYIPRKIKDAKEDIYEVIEFKGKRKHYAFKIFENEKAYVRFLAKCPDKLRSVQGDNDVDTDEDEMNAAINKCIENFRIGLKQSIREEETMQRHNAPRNKSLGPMLIGIQQSNRIPVFIPSQQHPNLRPGAILASPIREPDCQRGRNRSIFKANVFRG